MAKTQIPAELEAVTSEGIIAAASAIKDYDSNKLLSLINEDVTNLLTRVTLVERNLNSTIDAFMLNVTYLELVNLRNERQLIPGGKYRITDYDTCDKIIPIIRSVIALDSNGNFYYSFISNGLLVFTVPQSPLSQILFLGNNLYDGCIELHTGESDEVGEIVIGSSNFEGGFDSDASESWDDDASMQVLYVSDINITEEELYLGNDFLCTLSFDNNYHFLDYDMAVGYNLFGSNQSFKSNHYPFDLVLTAISNNELDCNAKAVHSERDVHEHFRNVDLSQWEIKYDLDNDVSKCKYAINNASVRTSDDFYKFTMDNPPTLDESSKIYYKIYNDSELVAVLKGNDLESSIVTVVTNSNSFDVPVDSRVDVEWDNNSISSITYTDDDDLSTVSLDEHDFNLVDFYYYGQNYKLINGKGIIYYMKDENNNECPYDFKNLVFKYDGNWINTFNIDETQELSPGQSLPIPHDNVIKSTDNLFIKCKLIYNNYIGIYSHNNKISQNAISCKIGDYSSNNTLMNADSCTLKNYCRNITSIANNLYVGNSCEHLNINRNNKEYLEIDDYIKGLPDFPLLIRQKDNVEYYTCKSLTTMIYTANLIGNTSVVTLQSDLDFYYPGLTARFTLTFAEGYDEDYTVICNGMVLDPIVEGQHTYETVVLNRNLEIDVIFNITFNEIETYPQSNIDLVDKYKGLRANAKILNRKIFGDGFNTLCLPFDLDIKGSMFEDATDILIINHFNLENGVLTVESTHLQIEDKIPAGTPFMVRWTSWGSTDAPDTIYSPTFNNVLIDDTNRDIILNNGNTRLICAGTYSSLTISGLGYYYIGGQDSIYWPAEPMEIRPFRLYFYTEEIPETPGPTEPPASDPTQPPTSTPTTPEATPEVNDDPPPTTPGPFTLGFEEEIDSEIEG